MKKVKKVLTKTTKCDSCSFETKCRWVAFDEPDEEGDEGMWTCGVCFSMPAPDDDASEETQDIFRAIAFATNIYLAKLAAVEAKVDEFLGAKGERPDDSVANGGKNESDEETDAAPR